MSKYQYALLWLAACLLLTGCLSTPENTSAPTFDIRGQWEYTMTASNGNTYDAGTITFEGELARGTYRQVNLYQVEYQGEYQVSGTTLQLTGQETWQGTIESENTISGTWSHAEDSTNGTFVAQRK